MNEVMEINKSEVNDDIVIVDLDTASEEFFDFVKKNHDTGIKFIVLERRPTLNTGKTVLKFGARAYGNSYMQSVHFISCVETVNSGYVWIYPEFTYEAIKELSGENVAQMDKLDFSQYSNLTEREIDIIKEIVNGLSNVQIAERLNISEKTVKVHLSHIFNKLHTSNRVELALKFH
ncbi:MAG: response regulator transcription factor [Sulfurospirillaceae bacterium]|nr:response regulator transcription factor [Sulfurospirillaceae bacterium]